MLIPASRCKSDQVNVQIDVYYDCIEIKISIKNSNNLNCQKNVHVKDEYDDFHAFSEMYGSVKPQIIK